MPPAAAVETNCKLLHLVAGSSDNTNQVPSDPSYQDQKRHLITHRSKKIKRIKKKLCVHVLLHTVNAASPSCFNYTGCPRRATAAVARCIVFPDVLSCTEDSSAARVRGRDSCPKRASISRKVLSCWSPSTCWEATSSWSPLCLNPANIWGAGPSRHAFNEHVLQGSISVVFSCAGLLLVTCCSLSCPWSLSS